MTLLTAWDALSGALETTMLAPGTLTVTRPDGTERWCKVVLAGAAQPSFDGGAQFLQYQLTLRAPDPRWYDTNLNTSALTMTGSSTSPLSANVLNYGNAPAYGTYAWTSPAGNSFINYARITVPSSYSALSLQGSAMTSATGITGQYQSVNNYFVTASNRTASPSDLQKATDEWPILYPGTSVFSFYGHNYAGGGPMTCTLSWYDAWW